MADRTRIEWTDASWNPIRARHLVTDRIGWHCAHVSPGCIPCYAEAINHRLGTGVPYRPQSADQVEIFLDMDVLRWPIHWTKARRVFPCSMTDLFGDFVTDNMRDLIFAAMALAPRCLFQVVTKRADAMAAYFADPMASERRADAVRLLNATSKRPCAPQAVLAPYPLSNVWLGVSVEDQRRADERRAALADLADAGWRTWISYEPALGMIDWTGWEFLDWFVGGGQSGLHAAPMHPEWQRAARDFCASNGIPYFFKQWGVWAPVHAVDDAAAKTVTLMDIHGRRDDAIPQPASGDDDADYWTAWYFKRVGKAAAGRHLDGVTHDALPAFAPVPHTSENRRAVA